MEPPGEEGTKVYINDEGHTTKMAAMLYMVKTFKKFLSGTTSPMILKLSMYHRGLKLYKVYINDEGHTTKMAAMLYMVKTFKKFLSGTTSPMILKLSMYHRGLKLYKVYINGYHEFIKGSDILLIKATLMDRKSINQHSTLRR